MCDLFQANPWKPLLCTNCHQNRSGHPKTELNQNQCEHLPSNKSNDLSSSSSTMHLYEEIMAQYFTSNTIDIDSLQSTSAIEQVPIPNDNETDDDSFSDEEQDSHKPSTVEYIKDQSMINTEGIVLIGPDLRAKQTTTKKPKKFNLLKKSKSNADECSKKMAMIDHNTSKLWRFKVKKTNPSPVLQTELNRSNVYSIFALFWKLISLISFVDFKSNIEQPNSTTKSSCFT